MSVSACNGIMAVCIMIITLFIIVWTVGMLIAVFQIRKIIKKITANIEQPLAKTNDVIGTVNSLVQKVRTRVDNISSTAEETVDVVSTKVRNATDVITESAASPFITMSSILTGLSIGLDIFGKLKKRTKGKQDTA